MMHFTVKGNDPIYGADGLPKQIWQPENKSGKEEEG